MGVVGLSGTKYTSRALQTLLALPRSTLQVSSCDTFSYVCVCILVSRFPMLVNYAGMRDAFFFFLLILEPENAKVQAPRGEKQERQKQRESKRCLLGSTQRSLHSSSSRSELGATVLNWKFFFL